MNEKEKIKTNPPGNEVDGVSLKSLNGKVRSNSPPIAPK
jgi:hypothetical protein